MFNDLASAVNSLQEYSGKESEDITKWIEKIHLLANVFQLQGNDIRKLIISKLRDQAQTFVANSMRLEPNMDYISLMQLLQQHFISTSDNHQKVQAFLKI